MNFCCRTKGFNIVFILFQDLIMNLLSSLQPTEVVDGEWEICHLMILEVVVLESTYLTS